MSDTKSKNSELIDWYEECAGMAGMGYAPDAYRGNEPEQPPHNQQPDYNIQVIKPPEQEEKKVEPEKKIEDLGEMYKAVVTAKMISGKLMAYSTKESDEDKSKLKTDIKELVKKLGDIANGL
jgi:hypothetical protein